MRIKDRYEYDPAKDLVGKGGFARVFRAQDTLLNREVALKVFSHSDRDQYSVLQEIRKAIQLEHPNLLRYYDVVLLEQSNALGEKEELQIGVMEYANAGDLKIYSKANPGSPHLKRFLREVLLGLEYLHNHGIIHRDLKAQNILLLERNGHLTAKISDFGISKNMSSEDTRSSSMLVGTIEYMAPEQFNPRKFGIDGKIRPNVDLWGFGVMVHEMLTDQTPFGKRGGETTAEQIMASILSPELPKDIDKLAEPYRTIVKKCLVANAKDRVQNAADLLVYLDDAGVANVGNNEQSESATGGDAAATRMFAKGDVGSFDNPEKQTAPFTMSGSGADEEGGSGTVFYDSKAMARADVGGDGNPEWTSGESVAQIKIPDGEESFGGGDGVDADKRRRRLLINIGIAVLAVIFLAFVAVRTMNGDGGTAAPPVQASGTEAEKAVEAKAASEPTTEPAAKQATEDSKAKQAAETKPKPKAVAEAKKCEEVCTSVPGKSTSTQNTTSVSAGEFSYPAGGGIPQDRARSLAVNACGSSRSMISFTASPDGQCGGNLCFARVRATCGTTQTVPGKATRKCERVCR